MEKQTKIEYSKGAIIGMSSLPLRSLKSLKASLAAIQDDFNTPLIKNKFHKLRTNIGVDLFSLKIGVKYRAIIKVQDDTLIVLDIVNHDALRKFFGKDKHA